VLPFTSCRKRGLLLKNHAGVGRNLQLVRARAHAEQKPDEVMLIANLEGLGQHIDPVDHNGEHNWIVEVRLMLTISSRSQKLDLRRQLGALIHPTFSSIHLSSDMSAHRQDRGPPRTRHVTAFRGDAVRSQTGPDGRRNSRRAEMPDRVNRCCIPLELIGLVTPLPADGPVPGEIVEHQAQAIGHAAVPGLRHVSQSRPTDGFWNACRHGGLSL
jgi:hypothetical protein